MMQYKLHVIFNLLESKTKKVTHRTVILDFNRHDLNSKVIVTLFSLFGELERDFISLRTKEALASKKAKGHTLGKPKGTIQKSQFDEDRDRIVELLSLGLSVRKIANLLSYKNHISLNTYINKRNLKIGLNNEK